MGTELKAIETHHKGYRFRSRLEARWSVVLDRLGIDWRYEDQGYNLPCGPYLPDFWLPEYGMWFEVKGCRPTGIEIARCYELADIVPEGRNYGQVFMVAGGIPEGEVVDAPFGEFGMTNAPGEIGPLGWLFWSDGCIWTEAEWMQCRVCGKLDVRSPRFTGCCEGPDTMTPTRFVLAAYDAGRGARFEHGEKG